MRKTILILTLLFLGFTYCSSQNLALTNSFTKTGDIYISYDILFDLNKENIRPESHKFLDSLVVYLEQNINLTIEVSNHCDERYSDKSSACLTCRRAKSIAEYLVSKGIEQNRVTAKGYNAKKPLIEGAKTEEEHKKNRRTEFRILTTDYK